MCENKGRNKIMIPTEEHATIETTVIGVVDTVKETFLELMTFVKTVNPDV